ncbi:sodium:calcium antiporter [Haloarcula litorea]|uniref:sodium:calcium antiporter n=1 Tax=Haloarcula litorea TaxID=3032579 RepID=UPI0023E80AEC|nr:sodium:calcium antiporter [Halomicroarcula sp. GDY20]
MAANLLVEGVVIVAATAAIWKGSDWLEASSERLATHYGLPQVVQGAVVVAVGSSFPELASVVVAALGGSLALGVGAIVGSAIFNVLVIPAVAGIATDEHVESNRTLVYKEAQFYMLAVSVLLVTFALAVIYYPGDATLTGTVTRPLAFVPLALYGLYVFIQYQDTTDHRPADDPDEIAVGRQWALLVAALAVILVAVERLVHALRLFGEAFAVPEFLLGVTVLAAATSLPDTLVSVRAARADRAVASLANVLGSNTFDLLVAVPVGVLIAGPELVDFAMAVPMFAVLTGATVLLFTVLRTDLELSDREAYLLVATYVGFLAWVVAETAGVVTGVLPSA